MLAWPLRGTDLGNPMDKGSPLGYSRYRDGTSTRLDFGLVSEIANKFRFRAGITLREDFRDAIFHP